MAKGLLDRYGLYSCPEPGAWLFHRNLRDEAVLVQELVSGVLLKIHLKLSRSSLAREGSQLTAQGGAGLSS